MAGLSKKEKGGGWEKKEIRDSIMMFPSSPPGVTAMGDNDPDSQLEICDVI